jgi:hypothetical protein
MACSCKDRNKKRETYKVKLPGGLTVTKSSEADAKTFAAKHPGSKVLKTA